MTRGKKIDLPRSAVVEDFALRGIAVSVAMDEVTCTCEHNAASHSLEGRCRECQCTRFIARASLQPQQSAAFEARVRAEIEAVTAMVNVLLPLAPDERARVLLVIALQSAPNALTDEQLMILARAGKNPNP